ncbi:MAG: two-component system histidine kinase PnpS [Bacillota bacterium]
MRFYWRQNVFNLFLLVLISLGIFLLFRGFLNAILQANAAPGSNMEALGKINIILLAAVVLSLCLFGLATLLRNRKTIGSIRALQILSRRLAEGNLDPGEDMPYSGELRQIARSMTDMALHFRDSLKEITLEQQKLNAILSSMSDGVIAVDQIGRLLLINKAAEKALNVDGSKMIGKYILEVVRNYEVDAGVRQVLATGETVTKELKLSSLIPETFILHIAPIPDGERVAGAVMVIRDVTELRRLERIRSEFVANVSHELRTPLTSIKGFVETLLDGALEDEQASRRFLRIVSMETNRLQRLVEDLLFLAQLESSQTHAETSPEITSLAVVVEKVVAILAPLAQERGVSLETSFPSFVPNPRIGSDLLGQVLMNLTENAIKYTSVGGKVTITAESLGADVKVSVIDTGIGIPEESRARIFERFFRVDKARSRKMGGTGLGLAIVKHVIEAHDGTVSVESEVGKGSTFSFTIPGEYLM